MVTEALGAEQEKRVAAAIAQEADMVWTKAPNGWVVTTASGAAYLVTVGRTMTCSCMDFQKRCVGSELRCKHCCALARKLARDAERQAPPVVADEEAARIAREDAIFDRIYGNG